MAKPLIVHDDLLISRVAYLLEQRMESIRRCEAILRGDKGLPEEYYRVNKDQVKMEFSSELWALNDLIEDIEDGLFVNELRRIFREYVQGKGEQWKLSE